MRFKRVRTLPWPLAIVATAVILTGLPSSAVQAQTGVGPDLTGEWSLNSELSEGLENAAEKGAGRRQPPGGGGGRPGGGGGMPGGGGGMGRGGAGRGGVSGGPAVGMDRERMKQMRASMIEAMRAPTRITIIQSAATVTFTDSTGLSQAFAVDGKKEKHQLAGQTVETRTKWSGDRLNKEIAFADGLKATETLSIFPGQDRLQVTVKVESSRLARAMTQKRIYDRTSQSSGGR